MEIQNISTFYHLSYAPGKYISEPEATCCFDCSFINLGKLIYTLPTHLAPCTTFLFRRFHPGLHDLAMSATFSVMNHPKQKLVLWESILTDSCIYSFPLSCFFSCLYSSRAVLVQRMHLELKWSSLYIRLVTPEMCSSVYHCWQVLKDFVAVSAWTSDWYRHLYRTTHCSDYSRLVNHLHDQAIHVFKECF